MFQDQTNNEKRFIEEYDDLFRYIAKYVSFRIPRSSDVEDVVSEIFLHGYAHIASFREEKGSMRQWFTGIAHRAIADYWRNIQPTRELSEALHLCAEVDHLSTQRTIDVSQYYESIMENLSDAARALFTLRYVDGLTYEEIASSVGKKPSAIRTYFARSLARIRKTSFYEL